MKTAIFITDASFNKKDKTALIGIKNITDKKTYQKSIIANNPKEAEKEGIYEVIKIASKEKVNNLIIFCDNKFAIQEVKKDFFSNEINKTKFWYIQFVWLKREYLEEADFLSKNINIELEKEVKENKNRAIREKIEKLEREATKHIFDVKIDNSIVEEVFNKRKNQFHKLITIENLESTLFTKKDLTFKEAEENIFLEIEKIEKDLSKIEDNIEKTLAQILFSLVISFSA